MATDLLGKIKPKSDELPSPISAMAGMGPSDLNTKQNIERDVAKLLMGQSRAERRAFKKKYGIFMPGSTKPFINKGKKK